MLQPVHPVDPVDTKVPAKVPKRPKAASPKKEAVKVGKVQVPRSRSCDPIQRVGMSWDVFGCFGRSNPHTVRDSLTGLMGVLLPGQEASGSSTCFGTTSCLRPKSCLRVGRDRLSHVNDT